jgi:hypothetical protein
MKQLFFASILALAAFNICSGQARADDQTCKATATDKKLAGAAQTSFMKKCQADATKACEATAADKKLAGAAKTSFTKKCVNDAVGT